MTKHSCRMFAFFTLLMWVSGSQVPGLTDRFVLDDGHMDLRFDYGLEGWMVDIYHDDHGAFGMDDVVIQVRDGSFADGDGARIQRPAAETWAFIGVDAGEPFWLLPAAQVEGLIWPGFAAERTVLSLLEPYVETDPRVVSTPARWIAITLESVTFHGDGTGHVSKWVSAFGETTVFWSTAIPPEEGDRFFQLAGGHSHVNWGFSHPGRYELVLRASTVPAGDPASRIFSEPVTLTVVVGDWPENGPGTIAHPLELRVEDGTTLLRFDPAAVKSGETLWLEESDDLKTWHPILRVDMSGIKILVDGIDYRMTQEGMMEVIREAGFSPSGFARLRSPIIQASGVQ